LLREARERVDALNRETEVLEKENKKGPLGTSRDTSRDNETYSSPDSTDSSDSSTVAPHYDRDWGRSLKDTDNVAYKDSNGGKIVVMDEQATVKFVRYFDSSGTQIGYARYNESPDGEISITSLYVDKNHRSQGVGSELLEQVEKRAGGRRVSVVDPTIEYADFYDKHGYRREGSAPLSKVTKVNDASNYLVKSDKVLF
jgi:ribosomal protein S18 acetylase RimI-like enzyme